MWERHPPAPYTRHRKSRRNRAWSPSDRVAAATRRAATRSAQPQSRACGHSPEVQLILCAWNTTASSWLLASSSKPLALASCSESILNVQDEMNLSFRLPDHGDLGDWRAIPSVSIIRCRGIRVLLHSQISNPRFSELFHILRAIGYVKDPTLGPVCEVSRCFGLSVVLPKESIIALVISLHRRRMRSIWTLHHRRHQKAWNYRPVRIAGNHLFSHNPLSRENHFLRRTHAFQHHAKIPPTVRIALSVGTLYVNNRYVRLNGSYCKQRLLGLKRRDDLVEKMIALGNIAAHRRACRQKRHSHSARLQSKRDAEVGHVENLELLAVSARILVLCRATEVVGRAHHHIAHPGRDHILHASRANELIKQYV